MENQSNMANFITFYIPAFVGLLYFITGCAYLYKKEWAWSMIFLGYAFSQVGLVIAGNQH